MQFPEIRNPSLSPEPIPLEIVYEDEALVVINKPKGLVVHVGAGHFRGTLVNALLAQVDQLAEGAGKYRPGIVHRLDKDTSGLMLVAKTNESYAYLTKQLQDRLVKRVYVALVQGFWQILKGPSIGPWADTPGSQEDGCGAYGTPGTNPFSVQERFRRHSLLKCSW